MADEKKMPARNTKVDAEPGHQLAEARKDQVSDFNAARRAQEQGALAVGLQDSEALSPAPWPVDAAEVAKVQVEREAKRLEARAKELRESLKDAEGEKSSASK